MTSSERVPYAEPGYSVVRLQVEATPYASARPNRRSGPRKAPPRYPGVGTMRDGPDCASRGRHRGVRATPTAQVRAAWFVWAPQPEDISAGQRPVWAMTDSNR
jgi:hypothetical protein